MHRTLLVALGFLFFGLVSPARSEVIGLPESRHHQFLTYALFTEEQSDLLWRSGDRAWGAIASSIAFFEENSLPGKPQLVFFGSVNAGFRVAHDRKMVLTETLDTRLGPTVEFTINEKSRFWVGWTHESGHVSDDVPNIELLGPNLGNEILHVRYWYDAHEKFRVGGTAKVYVGSDPETKTLGANQFFELYPLGHPANPKGATLFLASSLEEGGPNKGYGLNFHAQAGVYFGNHTGPQHQPNLRLAGGYYTGWDPRLKYQQYRWEKSEFAYLGFLFNI